MVELLNGKKTVLCMAKLNLGQSLQSVKDPALRTLLQQLEDSINHLSDHVGADPVGERVMPHAVQGVDVAAAGEMVHISVNDSSEVQRGIHYFVEADTDPNFPRPFVVHQGASRTALPVSLPTKDGSGNTISYYFRAYSQYPGSPPSPKIAYGGLEPTAVTLGGATQLDFATPTGSGTAAADGRQGGEGFGVMPRRGVIQPKRKIPA